MVDIIIKDSVPKGRTRSGEDEILGCHWGTTSFRNEEDKDKAQFLERKLKKKYGTDTSRVTAKMIGSVK